MKILGRRLLSFAKFYPFKRSAAAKPGVNLKKVPADFCVQNCRPYAISCEAANFKVA